MYNCTVGDVKKVAHETLKDFKRLYRDIGGALGLFLGASMLTIIELVYLCYQYRICGKLFKKTDDRVREWYVLLIR
ncbi:hypothetical protein ANCDUO_12640 [Ancylostoma duodenale]|uniref:Amiloride-sensitive sodium channel n=1 Tax=Ancylostoma duodenale TaxID=51022 RepID=A0A0C2GJB1_9BILA|nr:hypothetical protein ANCDUO_12640 [Ancylostoma duodenale]